MNRTFLELQNAIKEEMKLDPGLITDNERKQFINDCISDIGDIALFEKEVTLTAIDGVVTIPDDMVQPIYVRSMVNGALLPPMPVETVPTTGTTPVGYVMKYTTFELYPKPAGNTQVELYYAYRPAPLVNDTDRPDIPNGYDNLIVDFSVGRAQRKNGNIGLYREYTSAYEDKKRKLYNELLRRTNSRVVAVFDQDTRVAPARVDIIL